MDVNFFELADRHEALVKEKGFSAVNFGKRQTFFMIDGKSAMFSYPTGSTSLTDEEAVELFAALGAYMRTLSQGNEDETPGQAG